ncbi:5'-nucleotidase domain-containing protein 1 [Hermetia illucens]|nr:5'-nucleotidase domain-containing protein 1 [Hermetia illucens]
MVAMLLSRFGYHCHFAPVRNLASACRGVFGGKHRSRLVRNHCAVSAEGARQFSRYSANTILPSDETMKLDEYDIFGFDLDNTLLRYNLVEIVNLEYKVLAEFLVNKKGYDGRHLLKPVDDDLDFVRRGLFLDAEKGNVLQLGADGYVIKCAHGTRFLSDSEIVEQYGPHRVWGLALKFIKDPLETWNGPMSNQIRALLDYFDMPASLVFARAVDTIDEMHGSSPSKYPVWNDLLDGLVEIYSREHFANNRSPFFNAMKADPGRYILKTSPEVIRWLKELKKTKATYVVTGSNIDFANLTASEALGADWRQLFDVVIGFARKPGFFSMKRPFFAVEGMTETHPIDSNQLSLNKTFSQGNYADLERLLCTKYDITLPRSIYVGDNFIQDIYTPSVHSNSDTVAISEEMLGEGMHKSDLTHEFGHMITSKCWGSFFGQAKHPSVWTTIAQKFSKICAPSVDEIIKYSMNQEIDCFTCSNTILNGFHPSIPQSLHKS